MFCNDEDFVAVDHLFARSLLKEVPKANDDMHKQIATLMAAARAGHLCVEVADPSLLPECIVDRLKRDLAKPLVLDGNLLYLKKNWVFEQRVRKQIERLSLFKQQGKEAFGPLPETLLPEQKEAVFRAHSAPVSLITGGPGTGKTFTAKQIVANYPKGTRIAVCAPTGKAASLLKGVCNDGFVGTLHSLLGVRPGRNESSLPLLFDLIIVDECSMIDAALFAALLEAVREGTHLVLMGDPAQLPPVEAGSLFADLVLLEIFPTTELKQCMRTDRSHLLKLAQLISAGNADGVLEVIEREKLSCDLGFSASRVPCIYDNVWQCVQSRFSVLFEEKPDLAILQEAMSSFRILSCLRKGPLGTQALNLMLVKRFYMQAKVGSYVALPVLVTRNEPALDLYNGQMGVLVKKVASRENGLSLAEGDVVVFSDREISAFQVPHFEYAFCLSVHKSQGSEYDRVVLLVPPGSERFGREVLYTAVTRAKMELQIDGDTAILKEAIATSSLKRSGFLSKARLEAS